MKNKVLTKIGKYIQKVVKGGHQWGTPEQIFDTKIRLLLKDRVFNTSVCGHSAIMYREITYGKNPEDFCRVCSKNINKAGILRCNDYLIIRNKNCPSAICGDCIKNRPDEFYKAYEAALKLLKDEGNLFTL